MLPIPMPRAHDATLVDHGCRSRGRLRRTGSGCGRFSSSSPAGQVERARFLGENPHGTDVDPHARIGALDQQPGNVLLLDDHLEIDGHHAEFLIGLLCRVGHRLAVVVDVATDAARHPSSS